MKNLINKIKKQKIKLNIIFFKNFSPKLNKLLNLSEKKTFKNKKLQINLALNYGSKFELINAFKQLQKKGDKLNEKTHKIFTNKDIPDPEILIRTETKRLSNFLLWQLAYSEIFLKRNYGQTLMKKIIISLKSLKRLKKFCKI